MSVITRGKEDIKKSWKWQGMVFVIVLFYLFSGQIYLRGLSEKTLVVDYNNQDSVQTMMEREGLWAERNEWCFSAQGRLIDSQATMGQIGINAEDTIDVCARVRGGVANIAGYFNMSIPMRVLRDQRIRNTINREELKRKAVKAIVLDQRLDHLTRMAAQQKLARMTRDGSITRVHAYCWATGAPRSIVQPFGLHRTVFRKMALYNMIPGVKKASW